LTWISGPILLVSMRVEFALGLACALGVLGCAHRNSAAPKPARAPGEPNYNASASNHTLIVTPDKGLVGKVVTVNAAARFVVLNFPIGHLPQLEQQLNVYRLGLKVGEVKVTGPQRDDNIVGDVTSGDVVVGDEVRDR
jgi:hypothetical protein